MHANPFDRFHPHASLVHRLDPRVKVLVTLAFILSNVLLPDGAWLAFLFSWLLVLLVSQLASFGIAYPIKRSFLALPFALAALSAVFAVPGRALAAIDLGPWRLVATDAGLIRFASILVRSWLSVQMAVLLAATTPFPDLVHALRHLHVPEVLVAVISFMYRYLFVLADEALRLLRARQARSARLPGTSGGLSINQRARVAGNMAGQLFLRSYDRSERVYAAMQARGFSGQLLTLNPHRMRSWDWTAGALAFAALLALQVISRL